MKYIKIKILAVLTVLLICGSCEYDMINQQDPDSLTTDNYWRNENDAKLALMEAYRLLTYQTWRFGEYNLAPYVYRGDDVECLGGVLDWAYLADIATFRYDDANDVLTQFWRRHYQALNRSNWIIDKLNNLEGNIISEESKQKMLGEALFLRAIVHFELAISYQDVVLIDTYASSEEELNRPIAKKEDVWALIRSDLTSATDKLPSTWDASNTGRATKGAAWAFLGKYYLYQKEYANAHNAFVEVDKLGYELVTNFESLFDGTNENSKESIFEVQYSLNESGSLWSSHSGSITIATSDLGGWNMFHPSPSLMTAFMSELATDGNYDKRLYGSIVFNDPNSTFLGAPLSIASPSFKKFIGSEDDISTEASGTNYFLMRYADALLMDAEALNEGNNPDAALVPLNKVRARAGLAAFTNNTQTAVRDDIRKQRLLEFPLEAGIRFFDLVRWGIVKQTLVDNNKIGASNFTVGEHEYFPVPFDEYSINTGLQ